MKHKVEVIEEGHISEEGPDKTVAGRYARIIFELEFDFIPQVDQHIEKNDCFFGYVESVSSRISDAKPTLHKVRLRGKGFSRSKDRQWANPPDNVRIYIYEDDGTIFAGLLNPRATHLGQ